MKSTSNGVCEQSFEHLHIGQSESQFNRVQRERGKGECSNGSSHNWLKSDRPKVAVCPHQEDYCDTCSKNKVAIHAKQTTINRLLQSASASPTEIKKLEEEMKSLKQSQEIHKTKLKNRIQNGMRLLHLKGRDH